ncbi:MAG: DMT family transporter [Planctomycetes bacterium]|nr:DMT family transporter [Planctomycetota bacterium]
MDLAQDSLWWVVPALLAPLLWASTNLADRSLMDRDYLSPLAMLLPTGLILAIPGWLALAATGLHWPGWQIAAAAMGLGALQLVFYWLYFHAIRVSSPSLVILLCNFKPLFVVCLAVLLVDEELNRWQWIGIVAMVASTIPLLLGDQWRSFGRAMGLIVPGCMFSATVAVGQKLLGYYARFSTIIMFMALGATLVSLVVFSLTFRQLKFELPDLRLGVLGLLAISYGFDALADFLTKYAISLGSVSLVNAFGTSQAVWVAVGERALQQRSPRWARHSEPVDMSRYFAALALSVFGLLCGII